MIYKGKKMQLSGDVRAGGCLMIFSFMCRPHMGGYPPSLESRADPKELLTYILERWFLGRELVCFNLERGIFSLQRASRALDFRDAVSWLWNL